MINIRHFQKTKQIGKSVFMRNMRFVKLLDLKCVITLSHFSRSGMAWISMWARSGFTGSWARVETAGRLQSVSWRSTAWRPALRTVPSWCGRARRLLETTLYLSGKILNLTVKRRVQLGMKWLSFNLNWVDQPMCSSKASISIHPSNHQEYGSNCLETL